MTTLTFNSTNVLAPVCVVSWLLERGPAALACEVDMNADASFDVRILPATPFIAPIVEHFDTAVPAMERHAEIAGLLRDEGWYVTGRARYPSAS